MNIDVYLALKYVGANPHTTKSDICHYVNSSRDSRPTDHIVLRKTIDIAEYSGYLYKRDGKYSLTRSGENFVIQAKELILSAIEG